MTIRAVTTFLTPTQYGELALLVSVQIFCGLFLVNPVGQHINLHTHVWWDDGTLMARLKSYRNYVLAISFVGGVAVLGVSKQRSVDQLLWSAMSMFAMVATGTWSATLIWILNMLGFRAASVLWSIVSVAIGLPSSIFLVIWLPSATAWFAGQAIGMGVSALGAQYILRRHAVRSAHSLARQPLLDRRTVMTYCLPLALATGLMWLQLSGYRFVIEGYWGLAQLGFLAIGLQLAGQLCALAESLTMQFIYPLFYRRISAYEMSSEVELAFSDLLNTLAPLYIVLAGLIILSAPYLLIILVTPQYQDAITFVILGAGIELCRLLGNVLSNAAQVKRKTISLALPYAAGSVIALALIDLAGVRKLEISWAGAALMVGAIAMLIVMWIGMRRQVQFTLDYWRWISSAAVMSAMVASSVWAPRVSGLGGAIGILMLAGVVAGAAMLALIWNNPATLRLLNVQLRKN